MKRNKIAPVFAVSILFIVAVISSFEKEFWLFVPASAFAFYAGSSRKWGFVYLVFFTVSFFYSWFVFKKFENFQPKENFYGKVATTGAENFLLKTEGLRLQVFSNKIPPQGSFCRVEGDFFPQRSRKNFSSFNWMRFNKSRRIAGTFFARKVEVLRPPSFYDKFLKEVGEKIDVKLEKFFSASDRSLIYGMIFGQKKLLDDEKIQHFKACGLMHLLAVSGLHVGLFTAIFGVFLSFFIPKKVVYLLSIPFSFFYAFLCGASPSAIRAAFMFSILSAGLFLGRRRTLGASLFFAAFVMLLLDPFKIADISFQLSYIATFAIIFFLPILTKIFEKFLPRFIAASTAITLSSQIFLLPFLNEDFLEFSIIAPITNIIAVPIASGIVFSVFLFFVAAFLSAPLAEIFASSASFFIMLLNFVVDAAARIPFAMTGLGHLPIWFYAAFYFLLISFLFKKRKITLFACGIFAASVFAFYFSRKIPEFHFPVFSASDVVIARINGKWWQVNIPSEGGKLPEEYERFLNFYGIKKIEACFLTSSKDENFSAFEDFVNKGICKEFYYSGDAFFADKFAQFEEITQAKELRKLTREGVEFESEGENFFVASPVSFGYLEKPTVRSLEIAYVENPAAEPLKSPKFYIIPEREKEVIIKGGKLLKWL